MAPDYVVVAGDLSKETAINEANWAHRIRQFQLTLFSDVSVSSFDAGE
jgi:hypothetical protein